MNSHTPKGTVYIIDDDEAVRDSIRWFLEGYRFHAVPLPSAEAFLESYGTPELACALVDVRMAGMSGLELQDHLTDQGLDLPIAFITGHGDLPMAVSVMKKGALDFIQKPFDETQVVELVRKMLKRAAVLQSRRARHAEHQALLGRLTAREHQVLERIVAGRLNKQIALDLGISIKTVEAHRANIMNKVGAGCVADLLKIVLNTSPEPL